MTEVNLDDLNTDDNDVEVKYHDSLPITYNPKKHCLTWLMPTIGLEDFTKGNTYRAGFIELIGTLQFVLGSCLIVNGVARLGLRYPVIYISGLHVFLFMFMISSTAPGSGGHLNPMISMACACARIMSISKCVVYVVCQCMGAIMAGFLARMMVGEEVAGTVGIGQCTIGEMDEAIGIGGVAVIEFTFDFILLFVIYGMVIDPKQGELAGPLFGPLTVAFIFCFNYIVSGLINPGYGYPGAVMNPARCLGPAVAMGFDITNMWIWWVPPQIAAAVHGALYILIPPHHDSLYSKLDTKRKKE